MEDAADNKTRAAELVGLASYQTPHQLAVQIRAQSMMARVLLYTD